MAFCIPASQYDDTIHDIISGPFPECAGCGFAPSANNGSYFNVPFGGPGLRANSLPESLSFNTTTEKAKDLVIQKSSGSYMMALARRGKKKYNNEWDFYIDPDSLYFTDNPWIRYDLLPSDINTAFLTSSIDSIYVCFDISGTYEMDVVGTLLCDSLFGLIWEAERQDGPSGAVQCGVCSGECPPGFQRYGDDTYQTCLDDRPLPAPEVEIIEEDVVPFD